MHGSEIMARLYQRLFKEFTFWPHQSTQKPLRLNKDGIPTAVSLSGFVRKMSEETQVIFESVFDDE